MLGSDSTVYKFPENFAAVQALSFADSGFVGITVVSGKPHGALYVLDEKGSFRLQRQASLIRALPPSFAGTASFDENNKNHIVVQDNNGKVWGFFHVAYAPGTKARYDAGFVDHYLTPPAEQEEAKLDMARLLASKFAPALIHNVPIQDGPADRAAFLGKMAAQLEKTQTAGFPLPDDNLQHCRGVSSLMVAFANAINQVADRRNESPPFDDVLLDTVRYGVQLHDIGKMQIATHLNDMQLRKFIHPEDESLTDDKKKAIFGQKWEYFTETNYNHPVLGWFALSMYRDVANSVALHHQALVRDYYGGEREQWQKFNLVDQDLAYAREVTFFNRVMRVADVADAIINNGRKTPDVMVAELASKTDTPNFLGLPNIDPNILQFMLHSGVIDRYLTDKRVSPLCVGEPDIQPEIDDAFIAAKAHQLASYGSRRDEIESTLLREVGGMPLVANNWRATNG